MFHKKPTTFIEDPLRWPPIRNYHEAKSKCVQEWKPHKTFMWTVNVTLRGSLSEDPDAFHANGISSIKMDLLVCSRLILKVKKIQESKFTFLARSQG